jgi:N-acetyltransferase 10
VLRELQLEEPIRYAAGDPIERWLNDLLCLDATVAETIPAGGCPHPADCELYYIHRDTLFSYHKASEAFLHKLMALYVSSHYKNTPNDLQMLSDAPAHHLFCLLGPVDAARNALPDVLCVVQVCLEGDISRQTVANSLARGKAAAGDLIPWTVAQQFQDAEFASLSGARVVRIATHPAYQKMGYGARALELLADYYQGRIPSLAEHDSEDGEDGEDEGEGHGRAEGAGLHSEVLRARRNLPPLLLKLGERRAERLHWLGVSYGMTEELLKFWKRAGYMPVYLRQTTNDLTGEHTCVMLRELDAADLDTKAAPGWTVHYTDDFKRRFVALLGYQFRAFAPSLALQVLEQRGARIGNPAVDNRMSCHVDACSRGGWGATTTRASCFFSCCSAVAGGCGAAAVCARPQAAGVVCAQPARLPRVPGPAAARRARVVSAARSRGAQCAAGGAAARHGAAIQDSRRPRGRARAAR